MGASAHSKLRSLFKAAFLIPQREKVGKVVRKGEEKHCRANANIKCLVCVT